MAVMGMDLDGANVLVLGGTSGMGYATAEALLAAGASVAIVGRDEAKTKTAAETLGSSVMAASFNAKDEAEFREFVDSIDPLDHVVSFTGEQPAAPVADADHDMFSSAYDSRVWAARNACAVIAPTMAPGGSFVFCSGLSAIRPRAGRSAGAVATAAVESFVRAMAVELAPLRVNAICPGAFDTQVMNKAFGDKRDEILERLSKTIPAGRIGQPEEIAHAALFLLTNTYTTGITLRVDGGSILV